MLKYLTLLELLVTAVWMDLRRKKISNRLIFVGLGLGLLFRVIECGVVGIFLFLRDISFPVILFYLLFLMHALGAGDIKLFSVIGSFLNFKGLCSCIVFAFLFGAGISMVRLLYDRSLMRKMWEFLQYIGCTVRTREITCYRESRSRQDVICFSVPILAGYLYYLWEVVY